MKSAKNVYRRFVAFEEKAAAIYLQFASRFSEEPQLSSFWLDMAMHEKEHAGLLQFCLCEGLFAADLPLTAEMQQLGAFFQRMERRAANPQLSVEEAFSLAIEMELSEINAIYCHLTTTVHSSMYLLKRKIATSVPNHVQELVAAAQRFGVGDDAQKALDQLKKRCSVQWRPQKRLRINA